MEARKFCPTHHWNIRSPVSLLLDLCVAQRDRQTERPMGSWEGGEDEMTQCIALELWLQSYRLRVPILIRIMSNAFNLPSKFALHRIPAGDQIIAQRFGVQERRVALFA